MELQQVETELLKLLSFVAAEVLRLQTGDLKTSLKADETPVTAADYLVSSRLQEFFSKTCPGVVIVDEESTLNPGSLEEGLLIDPLDGTKEFVAGKRDFTINVAYVRNGSPKWGVVMAPAHNEIFLGDDRRGFRKIGGNNHSRASSQLRVVMSGSHSGEAERAFLAGLVSGGKVPVSLSYGSSLKICRLAEGAADLYPRFGPTMEWDTAAAHAVLSASGGALVDMASGEEMKYGKPEFRNGSFLGIRRDFVAQKQEFVKISREALGRPKEVHNA